MAKAKKPFKPYELKLTAIATGLLRRPEAMTVLHITLLIVRPYGWAWLVRRVRRAVRDHVYGDRAVADNGNDANDSDFDDNHRFDSNKLVLLLLKGHAVEHTSKDPKCQFTLSLADGENLDDDGDDEGDEDDGCDDEDVVKPDRRRITGER